MRNRPHPLLEVTLRLEECAHQLSNSVGMTMNTLVLAVAGDEQDILKRLEEATDQAVRATAFLQVLMAELRQLRRLAAQEQRVSPDGGRDQDG